MKRFFTAIAMSFLMVLSLGVISYKTASPLTQNYGSSQQQVYGAAVDASTLTVNNVSQTYNLADNLAYSGEMPSEDKTTTLRAVLISDSPALSEVAFSRLVDIDSDGWGDTTPELELSSADGSTTYTTTLTNDRYVVNETINGLEKLEYTTKNIYLTVKNNYSGTITLRFRIKTDSTYTSYGTMTFKVENSGVYFVSGFDGTVKIPYEQANNYTFDEDYIKQFVLGLYNNGTIISKDDSGVKYGNPVVDPATHDVTYECDSQIDRTLYNEEQRLGIAYYITSVVDNQLVYDVKIDSGIFIYFEKTIIAEDTIGVYIDNKLVDNTTTSNRYLIEISAGASIKGQLVCSNSIQSGTISMSNDDEAFILNSYSEGESDDDENPKQYFTLTQSVIKVGSFNISLVATDPLSSYTENIYLTINVTTTVAPIINLNSTILEIDKGTDITDIDTVFRDNIFSIDIYDGTSLDSTIIADKTKVIIECSITSSDVAGRYNVHYSYTDADTGLTGTATAVLEVIDNTPVISNVVARKAADDEQVRNGGELVLSTAIYFEINAQDDDGDEITYFASVNKGTITQDENDPSVFRYEPNDRIAGIVTFTFSVSDGHSSSENFEYTITFKDNIPPTITLKDDVKIIDGVYYLNVNRKSYIYFRNYIENVADNSSVLSNNDVSITTSGFTFSDTQERYSFTRVGNYSVTYTLTDESNNTTSVIVNIIVENKAPTAKNYEYEFGYGEKVELPLASLVTDDADGYAVVLSGFVMDINGNSLATDTFSIADDGTVTLKMSKVHNETQNKDLPYVGGAYFRYKVIDSDGVESSLYTITVNFKDTTPPVVTRTDKVTKFIKGRNYADFSPYGYFKAVDEIDGELDVTAITIYKGSETVTEISFDRVGEYSIKYLYKDSAGNITERTVDIEIVLGGVPRIELLATESTITLNGNFDIYNFIYKISDDEDGDITSGFKALRENGSLNIDDGAVDTSKVGTYVIKMYYVDSDGNASATIEFTLTVEKPKEFPIQIIYYGAGGLGLVLLIVVIRIIAVKRKMRI